MNTGEFFPSSRIVLQFAPFYLQLCPKKGSSSNVVGDFSCLWDSNSSVALLTAASVSSLQCEEAIVSRKQKKKKGYFQSQGKDSQNNGKFPSPSACQTQETAIV